MVEACRQSGMGRRQGAEGIHRYTESQSVATQRVVRFAPMLGMSDQAYARMMTANLRLMNKLRKKLTDPVTTRRVLPASTSTTTCWWSAPASAAR